jgi:hypothetical protein
MANVNIDDVEQVAKELNLSLSREQKQIVLQKYQRVVMDKAESWNVILKELILNLEHE